MEDYPDQLCTALEAHGLKGRVVSIRRVKDLEDELEERHQQGLLDEKFYQDKLKWFNFAPPEQLKEARSIIVVAVPRPQTRFEFTWKDKTLPLILPPTYLGYQLVRDQTEALLTELLSAWGFKVANAWLPDKPLSVHSGLAEYGRNNITYVPGMGSFYQLTSFFSDMPCEEDTWQELRIMARCQTCKACMLKCPTAAISPERFLLHAERCIVYFNEKSSEHPFPVWMDASVHNALIGCILCQQYCPVNKPYLNWFEGNQKFTHEETDLLLHGVTKEALPPETRQKLAALELLDALDILPRNLGIFFSTTV
jgi:epoxyqueuosine reductase